MDNAIESTPSMYETAGKARRDSEQREEWTFHQGIPILVEEVSHA